jgi:hypothetical protein
MLFRKWRIASLSSLFLFGCETGSSRHSYPDDPLLVDKKPVETKVESATPPALIVAEPTPPPMPSQAVASAADAPPAHFTSLEKLTPGIQVAQPAVAGQRWVAATPASRSRTLPEAEPSVPIRRQVPETYGHAADYSWLQGVLAKPSPGQATLRYNAELREDKWGGLVTLSDDPRLAAFRDGDLVLVEGELLSTPSDAPFPGFRIRAMWLVRRNE